MASHSVSGEGLLSSCQMTHPDERIGGGGWEGTTDGVNLELSDFNQPRSTAFWYSEHFFLKKEKLFLYSLEGHSHTHTFKIYSNSL